MLENEKIKKILISRNYLKEDDLDGIDDAMEDSGYSLAEYLVERKILTKDLFGQALAEYYEIPYADLNTDLPTKEDVNRIPEAVGRQFRVVLHQEDKDEVVVATDNPEQNGIKTALADVFPEKKVTLAYSVPEDIDSALLSYKQDLSQRLSEIIKSSKHVAPDIIDEIVKDATLFRASDIHFEPRDGSVRIRFRIDGVLQENGTLPPDVYEAVVNLIKVDAHLRIDEHSTIQDGAIRHKIGDQEIDLRISVAPVVDGEKIVIRVLSSYVRRLDLLDLGLLPEQQTIFLEAAKKPFGMIMVVGPTGSGKTTTLYGALKKLNRPEVNISTIEDPVEYKIKGVNHIQINPAADLTFSTGLRSIVRQDPDIILVGEIRDKETAEISVNAALTGHLLLTTFHANDAATAVPRLLEMDVESFLLASTLELVIAQRLVRKICSTCRFSYQAESDEIEKHLRDKTDRFFPDLPITLYKGKGCNSCGNTGYDGRTAIFEIIKITPEMEKLILDNPSSQEIWELAREQGSWSMYESGLSKVREGITTLEELHRVAEPPEDE